MTEGRARKRAVQMKTDFFTGADDDALYTALALMDAENQAMVRLSREGRIITMTEGATGVLALSPMQDIGAAFSEYGADMLRKALQSGGELRFAERFGGKEYEVHLLPTAEGAMLCLQGCRPRTNLRQIMSQRTSESLNRLLFALGLNDEDDNSGIRKYALQMVRLNDHADWLEGTADAAARMRLANADLAAVCRDCAGMVNKRCRSCTVEVCAADALYAVFDVRLIQIALLNLLTNAVKAHAKHVVITLSRAGGSLSILVQDDGDGLNAEHLGLYFDGWKGEFDPQQYLERHARGEICGTGLPVVQTIAQAHGGRVFFAQEEAGGTAFRLVFPDSLIAELPGVTSPLPESGFSAEELELSIL